ncbi:unnamed protein product, partial [Symbiodinium sp. CCMP2456]
AATRRWLLQNTTPESCYNDIRGMRPRLVNLAGYRFHPWSILLGVCVAVYQPCHKDFVKEDLYIVGFTCKLFSQESTIRFQHESVAAMFDEYGPHADKVVPFLECSRFFILENVQGCLKQSSSVSMDDPYKVTVVSDDTNVWVNNPSQKREIVENGRIADSVKKNKGMKRVQSLLGMLQHLILRRSDGTGTGSQAVAQIHAPCQLLPRANSWTILHRMRRWSLYSSVGCAPQLGGESLWNVFATVPLKLVLHCGDALPANHVCQAAEHVRWHQRRNEGDINASTTLQTECNCLHHQTALALKPGLLSVDGLCSGMVRMTRAMRATKFQSLFQEGLDILAQSVERRVVQQLPSGIQQIQAKQQGLLGILGHELSEDERKLILSTFNSSWDDEVETSGKWVHWCNGCCGTPQDCVSRSRECLRLLFEKFPQVPLLYRWKGWGPCQNYVTRGVFIHNMLAFLIRRCCSKHSQSAADQQAMDEDAPDLPLSLRQEIRMTKTLAFMTSGTIRADLGKTLLVYWPLATLMDFISLVETARSRAQLRIRSLALPGSQCNYSEEELRDMNWSVLGGAKGEEAVKDFSTLLLASPDEDILQACRVSFPDVLPHVFPAMCDAWRRLVLPAKKQKTRLLGVGRMDTSHAKECLIQMAKSLCGKANSWKAAKKNRRVTGCNVFQQEMMRGKKLRVGTPEYKAVQKQIMADWGALSPMDRAVFDEKAARQDHERTVQRKKTLHVINDVTDDADAETESAAGLSRAQQRRLGQGQLNTSLQALASHAVWNSGLGIFNHVAALRPSLVQNVDPASTLLSSFGYLPTPEDNPRVMPHMFCSCTEAHPGICKDEACYPQVAIMVQQFQRCLEVHNLQTMTLFKVQASSSGSFGPPPMWLLLGCVSKRPLSHVLGQLVQHVHVADVVTPMQLEDSWVLHTLHGVFRNLAKSERVALESLRIVFSVVPYDAIASYPAPSHFRVGQERLRFEVGPGVAFAPKLGRNVEGSVSLPFGIRPSQPARGRGRGASGRGCAGRASGRGQKPPATSAEASLDPDKCAEEAAAGVLFDDIGDVGEASAAAFVLQTMSTHDASPLAPEHMPESVAREIAATAKGLCNQHQDQQDDAGGEEGAASIRPRESSAGPGTIVAEQPTSTAPAGARAGSRFHDVLGLMGCAVAKRRMQCYVCDQPIHKGDFRLEHAFNHRRPQRSVHPECVGQIASDTVQQSITWLGGQLDLVASDDTSDKAAALREAMRRLTASQSSSG